MAAGFYVPRYIAGVLFGLLVALPFIFIESWYFIDTGYLLDPTSHGLIITVCCVLAIAVTAWRSCGVQVSLNRLGRGQLRTITGRKLGAFFIIGLMAGVAFGVGWILLSWKVVGTTAFKSRVGLAVGIPLGLTLGLMYGFVRGIGRRPNAISQPRQLVIQGVAHDVVVPLILGLTLACTTGLGFTLMYATASATAGFTFFALDAGPAIGLASAIGFFSLGGLAAGLTVGWLAVSRSPWPRYFVAIRLLARHQRLPMHFSHFLDWAYAAGLLRLSGIFIQFRHREFQDYLASVPDAQTTDSAELSLPPA